MVKRINLMIVIGVVIAMVFIAGCSPAVEENVSENSGWQAEDVHRHGEGGQDGTAVEAGQGRLDKEEPGGVRSDESDPAAAEYLQSIDHLSEAEIDGLLLMREEEKLAHDVYQALYEEWGLAIFSNIASSEAKHMEAVGELLDRFELDDPAAGHDQGEFESEELQALYDDLLTLGLESLESALRVGAAVEEIDILDLEELMTMRTDSGIQEVYGNLLAGSENHLRSFVRTLQKQAGAEYQPQYLDPTEYQQILDAEGSNGGGAGGQGQGGGGRGTGYGRNQG